MFNQLLYNQPFWQVQTPLNINEDNIVFNWFWLDNDSVCISSFNIDDSNDVEYNTFNIPQDNGKGFISRFWREKTISISWTIKKPTQAEFNDFVDDFKRYIWINTQAIFKYKVNWIYRQIKATCVDIRFKKEFYNLTFLPFEITLKCNEPFFYNVWNESSLFENKSTATITEEITNNWSVNTKPQIYFIFYSATWTDTVSVNIWWVTITFSWSIGPNDILTFDSLNKEVKLNDVLQDYTWTFQDLIPWFNTIIFSINWTYNADISAIYRKNFI